MCRALSHLSNHNASTASTSERLLATSGRHFPACPISPQQGLRRVFRRTGSRMQSPVVQANEAGQQAQLQSKANHLYSAALDLARKQRYQEAEAAFENLLSEHPNVCKAWVSYAQMEKRSNKQSAVDKYFRCREVLQRGMSHNPQSACLAQAWGLMELQRGNLLGAVKLLERCVRLDPNLAPVLNWAQVVTARKTVSNRGKQA